MRPAPLPDRAGGGAPSPGPPTALSTAPDQQSFLEMSLDVNSGCDVTSPGAFVLTLQAALLGPHSLPAERCQSRALAHVLPLALHREAAAAPQRGPGWRPLPPRQASCLSSMADEQKQDLGPDSHPHPVPTEAFWVQGSGAEGRPQSPDTLALGLSMPGGALRSSSLPRAGLLSPGNQVLPPLSRSRAGAQGGWRKLWAVHQG